MADDEIVTSKVQAERLEISRTVQMPNGNPETVEAVARTERDLIDALNASGKDFERLEVRWTCTVIGTTEPEPAKFDLHPGAPAGTRAR